MSRGIPGGGRVAGDLARVIDAEGVARAPPERTQVGHRSARVQESVIRAVRPEPTARHVGIAGHLSRVVDSPGIARPAAQGSEVSHHTARIEEGVRGIRHVREPCDLALHIDRIAGTLGSWGRIDRSEVSKNVVAAMDHRALREDQDGRGREDLSDQTHWEISL